MAEGKKKTVRRKEQPLVLLAGLNQDQIKPILGLAREWGWELRGTWGSSIEHAIERPLAGALTTALPGSSVVRQLQSTGCPVVRIGNRPHPDDLELPAVLPDLDMMGRMAADHFAERGFMQVAFAGYDPEAPDANLHAAYVSFRRRAVERDMTCTLMSLKATDRPNEPDREGRRIRDLRCWLQGATKPVGIYCFNDIMAETIALICGQVGLIVPENVAVLGHGNRLQCQIAPVRLSSVDPGLTNQVRAAMRLLRRMMQGECAPTTPIMAPPAGIVERRSTNVLAVADPIVAQALRFLWDHYEQDLSVEDVAREVGVNRRALERAFRRSLQRSVREELRRRRLNAACELLKASDDAIAEIADRVGYRSTQYLHRAFLAAYGVTPRKYRLSKRSQ